MHHPAVGELELAYDKFAVNGTLALLSALAADITPELQSQKRQRSARN